MKMCPFIKRAVHTIEISSEEISQVTTESLMECVAEICVAYSNGKCTYFNNNSVETPNLSEKRGTLPQSVFKRRVLSPLTDEDIERVKEKM